jgi:probable selenium-dependent hydroxylase accessory protein YqeC
MLQVMGAEALGKVILDRCHRPLRVAALAGCQPGDRLTPQRAATVLLHPEGARRALPNDARMVVVVTKVDGDTRSAVDELAGRVGDAGIAVVTVARISRPG